MRTSLRTLATLALLGGVIVAPGCADNVPTASNACPCATGYVCCASGVCAPAEASCGTATAALSIAAQGKWVGYVENASTLSSGSDELELSLTVDEAGELTGRMIFGTGVAPAPPTDGTMTWPAGTDYMGVSKFATRWPYEGFAYTPQSLEWKARRLRFTIARLQPWGAWCQLQTPHDWGDFFSCSPAGSGFDGMSTCGVPGGEVEDCQHLFLCIATLPCSCSAASCDVVQNNPMFQMAFDVSLHGDEGDGSLEVPDGSSAIALGRRYNVRLIRASR